LFDVRDVLSVPHTQKKGGGGCVCDIYLCCVTEPVKTSFQTALTMSSKKKKKKAEKKKSQNFREKKNGMFRLNRENFVLGYHPGAYSFKFRA
jgi:hypothetical protein